LLSKVFWLQNDVVEYGEVKSCCQPQGVESGRMENGGKVESAKAKGTSTSKHRQNDVGSSRIVLVHFTIKYNSSFVKIPDAHCPTASTSSAGKNLAKKCQRPTGIYGLALPLHSTCHFEH
jgi:hypothetical protein